MAGRSTKSEAWTLFDRIVHDAPLRACSPWTERADGEPRFAADYDTLRLLLSVPVLLHSAPTSGIPALAIDVWVAYELRRAGFDPDAVWPRADTPRILPGPITGLLKNLGKADATRLRELLASGNTFKGTVGASARILGKNYMKQVDVVMSDWDTGPELLISTKRMDDSYGNNAPNRIEESYGDAKNLRSRHPRAALGFVFALRSAAFLEAPRVADWILDLLAKLGREDDAYDSVGLIVPHYPDVGPVDLHFPDPSISAQGSAMLEIELTSPPEVEEVALGGHSADRLYEALRKLEPVELYHHAVPSELSPDRFFGQMIRRVLDNSPITRHEEARRRLRAATS